MDAKALQDDLQSLGFILSLAKSEMGNEVGRRRACSYDERAKGVGVTGRGGKETSEKRTGTGEDERQPVMAQLAAR